MADIVNPYIAGAPVTEAKMFFGREDIFQWIESNIAGQYADHVLVIHGQRRVGKTSVLKQLGNRLPKRYIPVFFDLQGRTHTTLDRFLWWLAREIVRVLKQDRGIEVSLPEKEAFAADLEYFERRFLPDLRPVLGDCTLLLTFDEFDNLEESDVKEALARPLIDYLRRLMGTQGLNFIFSIGSSGRKLENMRSSYTEFFKTALYKKISFLNEEQARNLIMYPVADVIEYEQSAVERIIQIAGGHPYFTQLTCHELFSHCQRTNSRRVNRSEVESILDDVVERGTVNLKFIWDDASDLEKWILAFLANQPQTEKHALLDSLRKHVRFSDAEYYSALVHLREKDILTPENQFVIYLFQLWLQKNHSLEQVREELTEVNPIANHYIEIGLEYRENKQYIEALESFRDALKVDKDNIQAQVSIASIYLNQQAYEKAIAEFEKALAMDDEDITVRAGLCEALLALGDAAQLRKQTDEAIQSYKRILTINDQHSEARQRMAEIYGQRAESILDGGRTREALSILLEALKLTPEDPALIARVAKVQAEAREGELTSLLTRADTAAKSSRWNEAFNALNEYLAAKPVEVERQREHLLDTLQTVARGLESSENFEGALEAWLQVREQNPDAQQTTEAEIARVEFMRGLAISYTEAKRALNQKDYALATKLLKDIIAKDETYKDVLQLLARVTVKRSAVQHIDSKRLLTALGTFSIVAVISLGIGYILSNRGGANPTSTPNTVTTDSGIVMPGSETGTSGSGAVPLSEDFTPVIINALTVDPRNADTIYAGTYGAGIYISNDGGKSWTPSNDGLGRGTVGKIVLDPADPNVVYAALSQNGTVYKSTDAGLHWGAMNKGISLAPWGGWYWDAVIYINPSNGQNLYFSQLAFGLWSSLDGGQNWERQPGEGGCAPLNEAAVDPDDFAHLYAAVMSDSVNPEACPAGVYETTNGGQSWQMLTSIKDTVVVGSADRLWHIAADWRQSGAPIIYATGESGTFRSTDGGKTWGRIFNGCDWFEVNPRNGMLFCGSGGDIYTSDDSGGVWRSSYIGLAAYGLRPAVSTVNEMNVLYYADEQGISKLTYNEGKLTQVNTSVSLGMGPARLAVDPFNGNRIYLSDFHDYGYTNPSGYIRRSDDWGATWKVIAETGRCSLFINPVSGDLYCPQYDGLRRSENGGETWTRISSLPIWQLSFDPTNPARLWGIEGCFAMPALSTDNGISFQKVSIAMEGNFCEYPFVMAEGNGRIYAVNGDGNIYGSTDGGENWRKISNIGRVIRAGVVDRANPEIVYLGSDQTGILKTTNGGSAWQTMNNGLTNLAINELAMDPSNSQTLYAATDGGAFVTTNGGEEWRQILKGLDPNPIVYSIAVDPNDPSKVYAATPDGVFKIEQP